MQPQIFIIEKLPDPIPTFEGLVISLTPEISYQLSKKGIAYSIPEDFLPMQELYSKMPDYIKLFDKWLNGLDESLIPHFQKLKMLDIKPARLYGYWLGWIVGSYVTNSLFIKVIFEKIKPSKITYFRPEERQLPKLPEIWNEKETIPSILIPIICRNEDIELQEVRVRNVINKKNQFKSKILHLIYYIFKIYQLMKLLTYKFTDIILKKDVILSLHYGGWGIEKILKSARQAGYKVRYIPKESYDKFVDHDRNLINEIDSNMKQFNNFVGFDLSEVLKKKVKYFIEEIVPKLEIAIPKYQELFLKKRISIVLGYSKSTFVEHSIIAAAVASKSTLAVLFTHGYNALDLPFKESLSEGPCDLYLGLDEMKEYYSVNVFKTQNVIVEKSPLWVNRYTNIRGDRKKERPHNKPIILYIPAIYMDDLARLDEFYYSSCWYFEHQMKLLKYFITEKEFHFVWKGLPQSDSTGNLISDVIKENGCDNIEYSSEKLVDWIISADCSIMDYPSSYMYEVCASGLPSLALYHESFKVRNSAKALFGDILTNFSTTEDSISKIGEFLRGNHDRFVVKIDVPENKDFEIIERFAKKKCHVR